MTLDTYISATGLTNAEFASRVGVATPTISKLRRGIVQPSLHLMKRIREQTGGSVTRNDFLSMSNQAGAAE